MVIPITRNNKSSTSSNSSKQANKSMVRSMLDSCATLMELELRLDFSRTSTAQYGIQQIHSRVPSRVVQSPTSITPRPRILLNTSSKHLSAARVLRTTTLTITTTPMVTTTTTMATTTTPIKFPKPTKDAKICLVEATHLISPAEIAAMLDKTMAITTTTKPRKMVRCTGSTPTTALLDGKHTATTLRMVTTCFKCAPLLRSNSRKALLTPQVLKKQVTTCMNTRATSRHYYEKSSQGMISS
mmetsp:Transcript_8771/g.21004  ORF Transcript_8771/g.21004 Transcript_8771/m.21004 type:complete len:242 (+) Transcript_8771:966-1691(+)